MNATPQDAWDDDEIDLPVRHGVGLGILRTLHEGIRENLIQLQAEHLGDHSTCFDDLFEDFKVWVVISPTLYGFVDSGRNPAGAQGRLSQISTADHIARKDTVDNRLEYNWMAGPGLDAFECVAGKDYKFFLLAFEDVVTDHDWLLQASSVKIVEECPSHYDATRLAHDHNERATVLARHLKTCP